jgi:polyisoprenyl-teichoic acid--peptidoglycan teichoic acid transferase
VIPRTRRGMLWRFLLGAVVVIGASAGATAVAGLLQVKQLITDINVNPAIHTPGVTLPPAGAPQTILIIGSDHRAGEPFKDANTDTMMLVRLNSDSSTINVISIPRDLQVTIPGYGVAKLNAAYSDGGWNLMLKTLKADVFPQLKVNHIIDVNFGGFSALVNAIGCVYSDVDHRYYNNTAYTGYSSIDVEPGYQKLCGTQALEFVRFRHTDSDLVRNARQQDFIRWAKDQYGLSRLIANRDRLLRIFGKHSQTDQGLHTTDGLINLFDLVVNLSGTTVKQIKFPATFLPCDPICYDASTPAGEAAAYKQFITPTPVVQASTSTSTTSAHTAKHHRKHSAKFSTAGLTPDVPGGRSQAVALGKLKMPVYVPQYIVAGSSYCLGLLYNCPVEEGAGSNFYPRGYRILDQRHHRYLAYRMTLALNPTLGEYYGVQGTTWRNPPLLASPTETKIVAGKKLLLFADGGKLTTVGWKTSAGSYWISNTLTTDIPNKQMVSIAASLMRIKG